MRSRSGCIVAVAGLALVAGADAQVSFYPLGDLAGGAASSRTHCITPEGSVVVGVSESANGSEAFKAFVGGLPNALGDLPGGAFASDANGASLFAGVIVGSATSAAGREAFRWTLDTGMIPLGTLPPNGSDSVAWAVSSDGATVVGQYQDNLIGVPPPLPAIRAFRWTQATGIQPLALAPNLSGGSASTAIARAVSSDGSVVVGSASDSGFTSHAFRWTSGGGMVDLAANADARGCSPDGSVVVGRTFGANTIAFYWNQSEGVRSLGLLPGASASSALDCSYNNGERICGTQTIGGVQTACIWDRNIVTSGDLSTGWRSIKDILAAAGANVSGWTLTIAWSMCDDGQFIVGQGTDPSGNTLGWAAFIPIPPIPCAADINGSGTLTVQDVFDFLGLYFANDRRADFNGNGTVSVQDIFDFLGAYFSGC